MLTDRDVEIVRWIGRHRFATADQVSRRFSMHRTKTYERLRSLIRTELLRCEPGIRSARLYLATSKGIATANLNVPRATLSIASFAHDHTVVDVAIGFELDQRFRVLTEREIRRAGPLKNNKFAVRLVGTYSRHPTGCWPDLVLERLDTGELWAIEVELSQKKAERLEDKLHGYRASSYAHVTYFVAHQGIASAIEKHFVTTGTRDLVSVRPLSDAINYKPVSGSALEEVVATLRIELRDALEQASALGRAFQERDLALHETKAALHAHVNNIQTYLAADRSYRSEIRAHWRQAFGDRSDK